MASEPALHAELVRRLRAIHALKAGALRMFDPMLDAVSSAREEQELAGVHDLLGRMHGVFDRHRHVTAGHAASLASRLDELGARPSRARTAGVTGAAMLRGHLGVVGGMNFGAAARDAFVFEHLEVAQAQLVEQLALRIGDEQTAHLARDLRAADEEMAATIGRNWTNVLTLSLATSGLPTLRPPEGDAA